MIIPEGVTRLDDSALRSCKELTELVLPQSLYFIGEELPDTLAKCNIPKRVETLKTYAFSSNVTKSIKLNIQSNQLELQPRCIQYKRIWFNKGVHFNKVTRFALEKTSIDTPLDLRGSELNAMAFKRSILTNITISPKTVIEPYAFQHAVITKLILECETEEEYKQYKDPNSEEMKQLLDNIRQYDCKLRNPISVRIKK